MTSYTVTLDPGGFVVRDPSGKAIAVYAQRFKANAHVARLNAGEQERLFAPVSVMPGQLGMEV
jgi:hypothetical protein